jgi:hypothetical protein
MDSEKNSPWCRGIWVGLLLVWGISVGCQLIVPQEGWNKKKWGPLVPHATFPGDCGLCHLPERWDKLKEEFSFDHFAETGYRLEGAHAQAACLRCHNDRGPVMAYVSRGCAGCHIDPHGATLGLDCTRCHTQVTWAPTGLVAEHARTRFPLAGAHAIATCESCHEGAAAGQFRGAPTQCEACHEDELARAVNPDHLANGWTSDCQQCHQPSGWSQAFISHAFFPLRGGHGGLDCTQCHVGGVYTGLSTDCYSCHSADYQGAPNHVSASYSQDCTQCHSINGWVPASINHTFFPLSGPHNLSCNECHTTGSVLLFSCIDCHEHEQTRMDDKHQEVGGYTYSSPACLQCHPSGRD